MKAKRNTIMRRSLALAGILAGTTLPFAATGPADAQAAVQTISAADKAQGAKAHPQLLAEFGGAVSGRQADYVVGVGRNIAVQSGLGNARSDFTVTLLNSPVNNAFAIPGGYVYTTRQLVALMNNEAELAAVLGHEVGHVAARHADKRQKQATRNSVIGVLGAVLSGVLLGDSQLGQLGQQVFTQGSQLLTLRYSRSQETQADNLGITYLQRAGYDPRAMSTVLQSLANQNALEARLMGGTANRVPEWASTHPDPASRVRAALGKAGSNARGNVNRDVFLSGVDGLMYGDDPRQGIVEGRNFTHPDLRFAFQAPNGFFLVNGTQSVTISGQSGKGEFTGAAYSGDLEQYVRNAFAALSQGNQQTVAAPSISRTTVNGIPAAYAAARAQTSGGQVDVVVFAYEFAKDQAFHFLTITAAGQASTFNPMFSSMRRLNAGEAANVQPRRLQVVAVKAGDTIQSLAARMAYTDMALERFLVLNGLAANSTLQAGQKVKIVTY
ncbi:MAG: M48 family metalloprotease [Novosphingobium sp.]|nr:M48 family metalloprotease [Novosphingobium sp.]